VRRPSRTLLAIVIATAVSAAACAGPDEPSSAPTDEPTPESTFNAAYGAFTARIQDARARSTILIQDLATASAGTTDELREAADVLGAFSLGELVWWEAHPADPCYSAAFRAYGEAIVASQRAADAFALLGSQPSPPSNEDGQAAAMLLGESTTQFATAATLAAAARGDCQ
jgi:hypothetical protein